MTATAKTISNGNNESLSRGLVRNDDGTFTALTFSASKGFRSESAAVKWLERRGVRADGGRI